MKGQCYNTQGVGPKARTIIGEFTFVNSHSFQHTDCSGMRSKLGGEGPRCSAIDHLAKDIIALLPVRGGCGWCWKGSARRVEENLLSPPTGWVAT